MPALLLFRFVYVGMIFFDLSVFVRVLVENDLLAPVAVITRVEVRLNSAVVV